MRWNRTSSAVLLLALWCSSWVYFWGIPFSAHPQQAPPPPPPPEPTIVSAFYILPGNRKHDASFYFEHIRQFLRFNFSVVIFTSPDLLSRFPPSPRRIVVALPFEELRWQCKYGDSFWADQHARDPERDTHLPGMYVLWAEKLQFVKRVMALNPFRSEVFVWMDVGSFRDSAAVDRYVQRPFPAHGVLPRDDRLLLFSSAPFVPEFFTLEADGICGKFDFKFHVAATAFAGTPAAIDRAAAVYQRMFDRFVAAGRFAGKDQDILAAALVDDPSSWARLVQRSDMSNWFYFYDLLADPTLPMHDEPTLLHEPSCARQKRLAHIAR